MSIALANRPPQQATGQPRILAEGRNCWRIAQAQRAACLIDAAAYFAAFRAAAEQAQESIFIIGWDVDSRVRLAHEDGEHRLPGQLGPFLNALVSERPHLHVYILNWDFSVLFALEREPLPMLKLGLRTHRRVHFRLDGNHPIGAHITRRSWSSTMRWHLSAASTWRSGVGIHPNTVLMIRTASIQQASYILLCTISSWPSTATLRPALESWPESAGGAPPANGLARSIAGRTIHGRAC